MFTKNSFRRAMWAIKVFAIDAPFLWLRSFLPARHPKHYLAVAAIAKNEGQYFPEWIEWHKNHGVEKFYIVDNDSADQTREILQPYIDAGIVEYTLLRGTRAQRPAYYYLLNKHRYDARWIAFIDLDEFIVPVRDKTIPEFLRPLENFSSVEINWLIYGSNGHKKQTPGSVMDRFTAHSHPDYRLNRHVKSIINPRRIAAFISVHRPVLARGRAIDAAGNIAGPDFMERAPAGQDIIRVNHYAVKSYAEFLEKRSRGRALKLTDRDDSYFSRYDRNEIPGA